MNSLHHAMVYVIQKLNMRLNSAYLESIYQASYLFMAGRTEWLNQVPLASPNGGTACFSLLYILLSILRDGSVSSLLELGVGKSSVLLMQYARHFDTELTLIDHNKEWIKTVIEGNSDNAKICVIDAELIETTVAGKSIHWYDCERPSRTFDFLHIDGPSAYSRQIRYNRLGILNGLTHIMREEFIIVIDDSSHVGERLLVNSIMDLFGSLRSDVRKREILGNTSQTIIATPNFKKYLYL